MSKQMLDYFADQIGELKKASLFKTERVLAGPQDAAIAIEGCRETVVNMCANNYLGLANHPVVIAASAKALEAYGYGVASVRFICGTQSVHKALEERISRFLGTDDTILYSSCFDANAGLFETLLDSNDAIISDEFNHASIIDGIRLCRAKRLRYRNNNMEDLEQRLIEARDSRFRMIVTDGVFSMDGIVANLPSICALAERYDALVVVDDSHAVGFFGPNGRGTPEYFGIQDKIDLVTGTLGKALGGASGGYTSGRKSLIGWLRQRSRPYLFSNSLPPVVAAASIAVIDLIDANSSFRERLWANTAYFRERMSAAEFELAGAAAPIIPIMLGEAQIASEMADRLLVESVNAIAFSYPVVPRGKARIRTQLSAKHTTEQLDFVVDAFVKSRRDMSFSSRPA